MRKLTHAAGVLSLLEGVFIAGEAPRTLQQLRVTTSEDSRRRLEHSCFVRLLPSMLHIPHMSCSRLAD